MNCKYRWAGCTWNDRQGISIEHLNSCEAKSKPVHLAIGLAHRDLERVRSKRLQREKILNLYTSNDCWYQDICLKAYRVQDYGPGRLRFLSGEFDAFGLSWKLTGTIVSVEKNPARPTLGDDRGIELQLVATNPLYDTTREIEYVILKSSKV